MNIHFTRSSVNTILVMVGLLLASFANGQGQNPILSYNGTTTIQVGGESDCRASIDTTLFSDITTPSTSTVVSKKVFSIVDQFGNAHGLDPSRQFGPDTTVVITYNVFHNASSSTMVDSILIPFTFNFEDNTAPVISVGPPADLTDNNNQMRVVQTGNTPKGIIDATDNCASIVSKDSSYAFSYNNAGFGIVDRSWTFTDDFGNELVATQRIEIRHPELDFREANDKTVSLDTLPDDLTNYTTNIPDFSPVQLLRMAHSGNGTVLGDSILAVNRSRTGTTASHINDVDTALINAALKVTIEDVSNGLCPDNLTRFYYFEDRIKGTRDTLSRRYSIDDSVAPTVAAGAVFPASFSSNDCATSTAKERFVESALAILENENQAFFTDNSPFDLFIRMYETTGPTGVQGDLITTSRRNVVSQNNRDLIKQELGDYFDTKPSVCGSNTTHHFIFTYNDYCQELNPLHVPSSVRTSFEVSGRYPRFVSGLQTNLNASTNCTPAVYETEFVNWVNDIVQLDNIELFCTPQDSYQIVLYMDLDGGRDLDVNEQTPYLISGRDVDSPSEIRVILDTLNERVNTAIANGTCGPDDLLADISLFFLIQSFDCPRDLSAFTNIPNRSFINRKFRVRDTQAPVWVTNPMDTTVYVCGTDGLVAPFNAWRANYGGGTIESGCTNATVTSTNAVFNTPILEGGNSVLVTFTLEDACGNTAIQTATFNYRDTSIAFTATGRATDEMVECAGTADNRVDLSNWLRRNGDASNIVDCGGTIRTWNNFSNTNFTGDACDTSFTVTFYYEDQANNVDSSTATFSIVDTKPPYFMPAFSALNTTIPSTQTQGQKNTALFNWKNNFSDAMLRGSHFSDTCHADQVSIIDTTLFKIDADNCGSSVFYGMHVEISDGCSNSANAIDTAYFSITDVEGPRWIDTTQVVNSVVECDGNNNITDLNNWIKQNLNAQNIIKEDTDSLVAQEVTQLSNAGCFGGYTYRFFAQDDCGNYSDTLIRRLEIRDNIAPAITLRGRTVGDTLKIECSDALPATPIADLVDQCAEATTVALASRTFEANPFGPGQNCVQDSLYTYTWTATDCAGNSTTVNWYVLKEDTKAPNPGVVDTIVNCETINQADIDDWMNFYGKMQDNCAPNADINVLNARYRMTQEGVVGNWMVMTGPTYDERPVYDLTTASKVMYELALSLSDDCGNRFTDTLAFIVQDTIKPSIEPTARNNSKDTIFLALPTLENGILDTVPRMGGLVDSFAYNTGPNNDNIADQCFNNGNPYIISYTNIVDQSAYCGGGFLLKRVWSVTDVAMNTVVDTQYIVVQDLFPPNFEIRDTTINCSAGTDPSVTGYPTNVFDYSGITVTDTVEGDGTAIGVLYYADTTTSNQTSVCTFDMKRTWKLIDSCNNVYTQIQDIMVTDDSAPIIQTIPDSFKYYCTGSTPPAQMFEDWLFNLAKDEAGVSLTASDNCDTDLSNAAGTSIDPTTGQIGNSSWFAFHGGDPMTNEPADFVIQRANNDFCGEYHIEIDFIVQDKCGNADTQQVVFSVFDTIAPVFQQRVEDQTLYLDANCEVMGAIPRNVLPTAIDACQNRPINENFAGQVTSQINSHLDKIMVVGPAPTNQAKEAVEVVYTITNFDGEDSSEFLLIYDGMGTLLGQTPYAATQGGTVTDTLRIPSSVYNLNVAAGTPLSLSFEPFEEDEPQNMVERATMSSITFSFEGQPFDLIRYFYRIDEGVMDTLEPTGIPVDGLALGEHTVTIMAADCVENQSSTSFTLTVMDTLAPVVIWPNVLDTVKNIADCQSAELTISAPVLDNDCQPTSFIYDSGLQDMLFKSGANIDGYEFDQIIINVPANVVEMSPTGEAEIYIYGVGDFDGDRPSEGVQVVLEDNTVLSTRAIQATCDGVDSVFVATIDTTAIRTFASDGTIKIIVQNMPVPQTQDGDFTNDDAGINPCNHLGFPSNGILTGSRADGTSKIGLRFSYPVNNAVFSLSGATNQASRAYPASNRDTTLILNHGVNFINWAYADQSGNTTYHIDTVVVGDGENALTDVEFELNSIGTVCTGNEVELTFTRPDNLTLTSPTYYLYENTFNTNQFTLVDSIALPTNPKSYDYTYTTPDTDSVQLYYIVRDGGCASAPSELDTVRTISIPTPELEIIYDRNDDNSVNSISLLVVNSNDFSLNANETFEWRKGNTVLSTGNQQFESTLVIEDPTNADSGVYTFTYTGTNGCSVSENITVGTVGGTIFTFVNINLTNVTTNLELNLTNAQEVSTRTDAYNRLQFDNWLQTNADTNNVTTNGNLADLQFSFLLDRDNDDVLDMDEFERVGEDELYTELQSRIRAAIEDQTCNDNQLTRLPVFFVVEDKNAPYVDKTDIPSQAIALSSLTIVDNQLPTWVAVPEDETFVGCNGDLESSIQAWLDNSAGAIADDNANVVVEYDVQGTIPTSVGDGGSLDAIFTATDFCGNAIQDTATYTYGTDGIAVVTDTVYNCGLSYTMEVETTCDKYIWVPFGGSIEGSLSVPEFFSSESSLTIEIGHPSFGVTNWTVYCSNEDGSCTTEGTQIFVTDQFRERLEILPTEPTCFGGDSVRFFTEADFPSLDGTFTWSNRGAPIATGKSVTLKVGDIGTSLNLSYSSELNCRLTRNLLFRDLGLSLPQGAEVVASFPSNILCGDATQEVSMHVSNTGDAYSYLWELPDGSQQTTDTLTFEASVSDTGVYEVILTNIENGCVATLNYTLSFNQVFTDATIEGPEQVCIGDDFELSISTIDDDYTYRWETPQKGFFDQPTIAFENVSNIDSGLYTLVISSDFGCTQTLTQQVGISSEVTIPGIPSTYIGCAGEDFALVAPEIPGASYTWFKQVGDFSAPISRDRIARFELPSTTESGDYFVEISDISCVTGDSRLEVEVTINPMPEKPTFSLSSSDLCVADTLDLIIDEPIEGAVYNWSLLDGTSLGSTLNDRLSIALADADWATDGSFEVYVTASFGICMSDSSDVAAFTINSSSGIQPNAGPNQESCSDVATLVGNTINNTSGVWSQISGPSLAITTVLANDTLNLSSLVVGEYVFRYTFEGSSQCETGFDDVTVTVTSETAEATPNGPYDVCGGNLVELNAELPDGFMGQWSTSASTINFDNPSDPNTIVRGLEVGEVYTINWALTNACGTVVSSANTEVSASNPLIEASIIGDDEIEICNEDGEIELSANNDGVIGTWSVNDMDVMIETTGDGSSMSATGMVDGIYTFKYEINNRSCGISSDEVNVLLDKYPQIQSDVDSVELGDFVRIDVLANDEFTDFNFVRLPAQSKSTGQVVQGTDGSITFKSNGVVFDRENIEYEICSELCPDKCVEGNATVILSIDENCVVPTIFTPNNDGVNDQFVIPCVLAFENNELLIFNEWGDQVYSAQPYNNDWEGTFNGNVLPVGTYYYVFMKGNGDPGLNGFVRIEK